MSSSRATRPAPPGTLSYKIIGGTRNFSACATVAALRYGQWWDPRFPVYGTDNVKANPYDWTRFVLWDNLKDIGPIQLGDAQIRITPDDGFDEPGIADTSDTFAVDNRFVTPGPPKTEYQGPDFIGLSIDRGGLYPPSEFAIFNATLEKYVDAEGMSVSADPVWRTEFEWAVVEVKGLTPDTGYSFQVKARDLAIGLETELGPALFASTTPLGASAEANLNGVIFRLVLDKTVYQFAEPVNIQFIVTNTSATTFSLEFPSSCQFIYEVYQGENPIYKPYYCCLMVLTDLTLQPRETYVYSRT